MDTPQIQYARTADGVSIAYWTLGKGAPLVCILLSHLSLEWDVAYRRAFYERLAARAMLVRYDPRGIGMSARDRVDFSIEAMLLDLEAVVERLDAPRIALLGVGWPEIAVAYAARHPERVSRLATAVGPVSQRLLAAIAPLAESDWELYTNIWARLQLGWDSPEATQLVGLMRATHSPASFEAWSRRGWSLDDTAPLVKAPTLVLFSSASDGAQERARDLASRIPAAHVLGVPGDWHAATPNSIGGDAVLDFISSGPAPQSSEAPALSAGAFRTILFTDIEGHTPMMERLGDVKGRAVLREHERITREALRQHAGTEVKAMGDGFMASFASAQKAIECAIALQKAFALRHAEGALQASVEPISVRVGINAGEPLVEEDDLFGASVIVAARTAAKARGGEILVTDVVRQLVAGKGFLFADRGAIDLRGFEEPVRLYEVRWSEG